MTLTELNSKLLLLSKSYGEKIELLQKAELAFNLRFSYLIIHSARANQASREAEANLVCQEEGLLEPVQILKADVKKLYFDKECYIELSKNMRILQVDSTHAE